MEGGGIVMDGSVAHVFSHQQELSQMGLSVPQISIILEKLRQRGVMIPTDVYTVAQAKDLILKMFRKAWQE